MTLKFNPRVITDVKVVNSSKKTPSCPMGYEIVNRGCDLNHKAGGDYIYLCLKKEYLQNIIGSSEPVNSYKIQISNDDCGSLKKAGVDFNKGAGANIFIFVQVMTLQPQNPLLSTFLFGLKESITPLPCTLVILLT
jgi:hypothetical protein